jgi:hypothetical protein
MEDVVIFYDYWVYFTTTGYIFGHLVYVIVISYNFSRFGMLYIPIKIWQPSMPQKVFC